MANSFIALFGSSEKGLLNTAYYCRALEDLFNTLGGPQEDTFGIFFAIKILLLGEHVLYFRVRDEGESQDDYLFGMELLRNFPEQPLKMKALFLPGVGSKDLLHKSTQICTAKKSLLLMTERDFYDYMTEHAT